MTEKNLIINNRTFTYKGIFRVNELLKTLDDTLTGLGYQKQEKKTEETVTPSGRHTHVELRPFKAKTNYVTLMLKIKISLDNITETVKEVDGLKKTFQQGDLTFIIDAWSLTDYASRWGMKPWFYFLKAFFNKFIYHLPLEEGFIGELKSDANYLTEQLKALLNLYRYQAAAGITPPKEKEKKPKE